MLGEGSQMGDKCSVKRSVIGRHCRIGSNVKVSHKGTLMKLFTTNIPPFAWSRKHAFFLTWEDHILPLKTKKMVWQYHVLQLNHLYIDFLLSPLSCSCISVERDCIAFMVLTLLHSSYLDDFSWKLLLLETSMKNMIEKVENLLGNRLRSALSMSTQPWCLSDQTNSG